MEKMGTLKKNGDQKTNFGPHGDQSPQMGTNLGAVHSLSIFPELDFHKLSRWMCGDEEKSRGQVSDLQEALQDIQRHPARIDI